MSADQSVIYLICGFMAFYSLRNKNNFSYYLYKDCEIQNQILAKIERVLMIVLPLLVMTIYTVFALHPFVIRIWLILIVLLDFALQYFAKECGWLNIDKNTKISPYALMWIIFIIAIFFTVKS